MKSFKEYLFLIENAPDSSNSNQWNSLIPIHNLIKQSIFRHHAELYPHVLSKGSTGYDVEASKKHIGDILDKHPDAPFTNVNGVKKAIAAIHPHVIEGNYNLEELIYDKYPDETMGGDITELPSGVYDNLVTRNEDDHARRLHYEVETDLQSALSGLMTDDPDLQ